MGENAAESDVAVKNSAGLNGSDETDKAAEASNVECEGRKLAEKCEANNTNYDGSALQPQAEKSTKKAPVSSAKPQDNSFEKSRKWYNISFMQRAASSTNSRSANTTDKQNSIKMDNNRHSWHLNDGMKM